MDSKQSDVPKTVIGGLMASGFPFQTAITSVIQQTPNWNIITEEFPWRDDNGSERFLDLVATDGSMIIAVECKKTQKEVFSFLCPINTSDKDVDRVRCLYLRQMQDATRRMEVFCDDWGIVPLSPESMFCVVSTSETGRDQRLLERDTHLLVHGTDAFAKIHRKVFKPQTYPEPDRPYLPLLVTNAPLFVARYKPSDISLDTGQFSVPPKDIIGKKWVRFTKAFISSGGRDFGDRTVFVINSIALSEFLANLKDKGSGALGKSKVPFQT